MFSPKRGVRREGAWRFAEALDLNGNDVEDGGEFDGRRFSLPAGAGIAEDNGDLVIEDSNGTVVFRRNESTDEGEFGGADLTDINSVSTEESVEITEDDTIAYGRDHGETVQGENVVAGVGARALEDANQTVSGNDPRKVSVGCEAAKNDEQFGTLAAGYYAARDNTGNRVTAAGYVAARDNTGNRVTAAGFAAAQRNTGNRVTAAGSYAARDNTGNRVTAVGYVAAQRNTGNLVTAAGVGAAQGNNLSDPSTMGDKNIGIGPFSIRNNQASGLICLGFKSGNKAQVDDLMIVTDRDGNRRYKGFLKDKTSENASDLETLNAGAGLIVTSSDGTERRRITIDNTGSLVAEAV